MSPLEIGLVAAVALLTVVVAALVRTLSATSRRLDLLERRLHREQRHEAARTAPATGVPGSAASGPEADAVDIRGVDPEGRALVVPLEASERPTLLAFLSTSCGSCVGFWERLRDGDLASEAPGVVPIVVTKSAAVEDADRIRSLATTDMPVVLSSEAWNDYEVPGSPYVMVVSASPGSVVTEGAVVRWSDIVTMASVVSPDGSPEPWS